jgi:hypothetical protein
LNVPTTPAELQNAADDADAAALAAEATARANPGDPAAGAAKIAAENVEAAADAAAADAGTAPADAAIAAADAKAAAAAPADTNAAAKAATSAATAKAAAEKVLASAENAMTVRIDADMPELAVGGRGGENVQQVFLLILQTGFTVEGNVNTSDSDDDSTDSSDDSTPAAGSSTDSTADPTHPDKNAKGSGQDSVMSGKNSTHAAKSSTDSASNSANSVDDSGTISCHLVMRSLIGVMAAAAQEQDNFDDLKNYPYISTPTATDKTAMSPFVQVVPQIELQPIITLTWKPDVPIDAPLVQLTYRNQQYTITDKKTDKNGSSGTPADGQSLPAISDENAAWNRDAFRLISQLSAQVTVDISKFPVPTILQLTGQ